MRLIIEIISYPGTFKEQIMRKATFFPINIKSSFYNMHAHTMHSVRKAGHARAIDVMSYSIGCGKIAPLVAYHIAEVWTKYEER